VAPLLQALDASPKPREATDRTLPALLASSDEPVVVESYFGGWASPWRALTSVVWSEVLGELGREVRGLVVETGANRAFAERYGLEILPEVLVFQGGALVARLTGPVSAARIVAAVDTARERARQRAHEELELDALEAAHAEPVRSILRRRAGSPVLAHAG
jgi:thioredoxin-like negative regulator of GroEL